MRTFIAILARTGLDGLYNAAMPERRVKPPVAGDYAAVLCPQYELDLEHTLASGQAFRWRRDHDGWWSAPISPRPVVLRCWQDREQIHYQTYPGRFDLATFRSYFQLDVDLEELTRFWGRVGGEEIQSAIENFRGLRVAMQDPTECLVSFLCSSVAPIYRIRRMIDAVTHTLGVRFAEIGGTDMYAFPKLEYLADASLHIYEKMGLGFRGGNVKQSAAEVLRRGGSDYLTRLRTLGHVEARTELMTLPGVGAKIADCVCLFALGQHEAVPIDVHILRVAKRLFARARTVTSLTPRAYVEVQTLFQDRFGDHAGWAQQYLFYNELRRSGSWDEEMSIHRPPIRPLKKD